MDINSLLEDASGEHGHDDAWQDVGPGRGDGSDLSLMSTAGDVPDIDMIDISTGGGVNLRYVGATLRPSSSSLATTPTVSPSSVSVARATWLWPGTS